jgi:hypothetical protein
MTLLTLALAALLPAQAATAPTKAAPMSVEVRTAPKAGADLESWAKELRSALASRSQEFRLVKPGEKAEFVVLLDTIGKRTDGTPVLSGSFALGKGKPRPFNYGFTDVKTEAEKLARNLRGYAEQMKAAAPR